MLNVQTMSESSCLNFSFAVISQLEGFRELPYLDTATPPKPTIGIGFNLVIDTIRDLVIQNIGIIAPDNDDPYYQAYLQLRKTLDEILGRDWSGSSTEVLQHDLDAALASYHSLVPSAPSSFTLSYENAVAVFDAARASYEGMVTSAINMPLSRERAVLLDLTYNGGTGLLGNKLVSAIENGDRAEAWFEIRYNSGGSLAKRRYVESQIFGLYDDANPSASYRPSENSALDIFRMYTKHESKITAFDSAHFNELIETPPRPTHIAADDELSVIESNSGVYFGAVGTWTQESQQAFDLLVETYADLAQAMPSDYATLAAAGYAGALLYPQIDKVWVASDTQATLSTGAADSNEVAAHTVDRADGGGSFNDLIFGSVDLTGQPGAADSLKGGGGNDIFIGSLGADSFNGGDGEDTVSYARSEEGVTADLANPGDNGSAQSTGDTYVGIENLLGSAYADTLRGDVGNNVLIGGAGADTLYGRDGVDYLIGGAGNDELFGGRDSDSLVGGEGSDYFHLGPLDIIYDSEATDWLAIGANDVWSQNPDGSLPIWSEGREYASYPFPGYRDGYNKYIVGQSDGGAHILINTGDTLFAVFADGSVAAVPGYSAGDFGVTVYTPAELLNAAQAAWDSQTHFPDSNLIFDTYTELLSALMQIEKELYDSSVVAPSLELPDSAVALVREMLNPAINGVGYDVTSEGASDVPTNQKPLLNSNAIEQNATHLQGVQLDGTSSADFLKGTGDDDQLQGGDGADILAGYEGSDTYTYARGDGNDGIIDTAGGSGDIDTLVLVDIASTDVTTEFDGTNLRIRDSVTGQSIFVVGQFIGDGTGLEVIEFSDSVSWSRNDIEAVTGWSTNTVPDARDDNNYWMASDEGAITIYSSDLLWNDYSDSAGERLELADVYDAIGGQVVFDPLGRITFTVDPDFLGQASFKYHVSDGRGGLSAATVGIEVAQSEPNVFGTNGSDVLLGTTQYDFIDGLDGDDEIHSGGGDDSLRGGIGNDLLDGGDGVDTAVYSGASHSISVDLATGVASGLDIGSDTLISIEAVIGGAGDDQIFGDAGNNKLVGGAGNDLLVGRDGNDIYVFNVGDGHDTINDLGDPSETDVLKIGALSADVLVERGSSSVWDMDLLIGTEGDHVTVVNHFGDNWQFIEQVQFSDGVVWDEQMLREAYLAQHSTSANDLIYGFWLDDTLSGGAGNDTIYAFGGDDTLIGGVGDDFVEGDQGSDTYVYNIGDGADTVQEWGDPDLATDIISFGPGITAADITVQRSSGDFYSLELVNNLDGGGIIILGQFADPMMQVEQFVFADNTIWTAADVRTQILGAQITSGDDTINGFYTDDVIHAGAGDDAIFAGGGDDTIYGDAGNDVLFGGSGNDTFVFATGDGYDWIADFAAGEGIGDVLDLSSITDIHNLADVLNAAYETSDATILDFGNDEGVALAGVTMNTLHADDFRFAA